MLVAGVAAAIIGAESALLRSPQKVTIEVDSAPPVPRVDLMSCPHPESCYAMGWEREQAGHWAAAESMYDAACDAGIDRACRRRDDLRRVRRRRTRVLLEPR